MSNNQTTNGISPDDEWALIGVAITVFGAITASAGLIWLKGVAWLVEHNILVPAEANPLVPIPHTDGAGLDLARLVIAACVVAALIAVTASTAIHKIKRRRQEAL
ncbi:hypothetical protein ACQFYA_21115 [Promicromonospora sp. Marseille-Q5078]